MIGRNQATGWWASLALRAGQFAVPAVGLLLGFIAVAEKVRAFEDELARNLLAGRELGSGSMRPKVEAALDFVRAGGRRAVIAELGQGLAALQGNAGTTLERRSA